MFVVDWIKVIVLVFLILFVVVMCQDYVGLMMFVVIIVGVEDRLIDFVV